MSDRAFVQRLRTSGGPSHELLVLLGEHRILTTDQLAWATGAPVRTVRHRLDRLRTASLVDAVRPGRESGSAPRHWWLRIAGARLVAGTAAAPGRQRPSGLHVAHAAAIGEVWLAVRDHGPAAGLALRRWWSDRAGWQEWESTRSGNGTRTRRLTPDAVLLVDVDHAGVIGTAAAFVEVDLATMSQAVLRETAYWDRVRQFADVCAAGEQVARLLDAPAAAQLLAHWPPATRHRLLDDDPDVVDALLAWWADRDNPVLTDHARTVLVDRHAAAWTAQAEQLLAATGHGDHPRLRAAAAALQTGRLLDGTWSTSCAGRPRAPRSRPRRRHSRTTGPYATTRSPRSGPRWAGGPAAAPPPPNSAPTTTATT
ncbi:replication-relaxation family protein [Micromonospora sp. NPDC052213]|uniref:replication-relaxation family protein n=1 Tax=Micromonospora sp. NPDC052213 TaxID=3155812 RepID=UPI00344ABE0F